jgi:type IV pilus assembly protein PilB
MAKLGDMLMAEKLLTREQLQGALAIQSREGGFLGTILLEHGMIPEASLVEILSRQSGVATVDLGTMLLDQKLSVVMDGNLARKYYCVPVKLTGRILTVAMANPSDSTALRELSLRTGKTVKPLAAGPSAISRAWAKVYPMATASPPQNGTYPKEVLPRELPANVDKALSAAVDDIKILDVKPEEKAAADLSLGADDPPTIKLVNAILLKAIDMKASDIHLEPFEECYRVRFRIDGVMQPVMELPPSVKAATAARIKILSHMNIADRRLPQDGRLMIARGGQATYDFRVSCLPTICGEKIVIRILGQGSLKESIEDLGFQGKALNDLKNALRNPYGMILVTGPTGSGKTTTLYTILKALNKPDINIVTAEDPVEYQIKGITQVLVRPNIGYNFDMALRTFLRQDPDVILVGEMRDKETAGIAVKAALTGHLVLSTLHTNDAPSTVTRLIDMGVEPYLVSSAVKLVIAQRLVLKLCQVCKQEVQLSEADRLNLTESTVGAIQRVFRGRGCSECNFMGYRGRIPVFEVMQIRSREMKRAISEGRTEGQVAHVARAEGLRTLKDDVVDLLNSGKTSLEEAYSILLSE